MCPKKDSLEQNEETYLKNAERMISAFKSIRRKLDMKLKQNADEFGLTVQQFTVIIHLYNNPGITLNQLSKHMMLTKSTVSGIIDRLTKQNVVVREIPEHNRRIVKLSLSRQFKEEHDILAMKHKFIFDFVSNTIKDMDSSDVERFILSLEHFSSIIKV
jgi:DNA-binding MarR family transcriptional regulator